MYEPVRVFEWQHLADELLDMLGDQVQRQGCPEWIRVFDDPDGDVGFTVEASRAPSALLGWTAPPACIAVGAVATGRMRGDSPDEVPTLGDGSAVRLCCVVSRLGDVGWRLETGAGSISSTPAPTEGRLLDCLKRCIGLPTSPPATSAAMLHSIVWALSVLARAMESSTRLTWSEVTGLHPLARLLAGDLGAADAPGSVTASDLTDLIRIAANAWSWPEIRSQAAAGNLVGLIDGGIASWMDDGMFSRWVLSALPPTGELLVALRDYLAPSAAERLALELRE